MEDTLRPGLYEQAVRGRPERAKTGNALVVSVIIPHYDDLDNLRICLALLGEQTLPREQCEFVIVDNNSACGIEAVISACAGKATVVSAPIQGAGPARDVGVKNSTAPYLAFIDSDCRPAKDWLEMGVKALSISDMTGGYVEVSVSNIARPTPVEAFELVFAFDNKKYVEANQYSITGNMFVRRKIFESVGGFRSNISEDVDWGQRAVALGYRWRYDENVRIIHPARREWPELLRKWRRITAESVCQARQTRFGVPLLIVRTWIVGISPLIHTTKVLKSRKLNGVRQRFDALGVLYRLRFWRFIETHRQLLGSRPIVE